MEKKFYELTVVLSDKKTEKETKTLVEAALEKVGGRLVEFSFWGKKDLVRPIKKQGTVVMGYSEVELAPSKVIDLATRLRMSDEVLRHLLVEGAVVSAKKPAASAKQKKFAKMAVKKTAAAVAKEVEAEKAVEKIKKTTKKK